MSQGKEQETGDSTYRTSSVSLHLGDSARTNTTTATVTPGPVDLQQVNYQDNRARWHLHQPELSHNNGIFLTTLNHG